MNVIQREGGKGGIGPKGMIQYDKRWARQKVGCEGQERERVIIKFCSRKMFWKSVFVCLFIKNVV